MLDTTAKGNHAIVARCPIKLANKPASNTPATLAWSFPTPAVTTTAGDGTVDGMVKFMEKTLKVGTLEAETLMADTLMAVGVDEVEVVVVAVLVLAVMVFETVVYMVSTMIRGCEDDADDELAE